MNPLRLSHAEYWMLDLVQEYGEAIHYLANGHYGNNKRFYQYGREELLAALFRLNTEGWIAGYFGNVFEDEDAKDFSITSAQIEFEIDRRDIDYSSWTPEKKAPDPPLVFYRLTAAGGEAWETFARPKWDQFIDGIWFCDPEETGNYRSNGGAIGASKDRLDLYLRMLRQEGVQIDFDTITWSEKRPWQALYWKELPIGYEATFKIISYDKNASRNRLYHIHAFKEWYHCQP